MAGLPAARLIFALYESGAIDIAARQKTIQFSRRCHPASPKANGKVRRIVVHQSILPVNPRLDWQMNICCITKAAATVSIGRATVETVLLLIS